MQRNVFQSARSAAATALASSCSFSGGGVGISDAINVRIPCSTYRQVETLCSSGRAAVAAGAGVIAAVEPDCSAVVRVFCNSVFSVALGDVNDVIVDAIVAVSCPSDTAGAGSSLADRCIPSGTCDSLSFLERSISLLATLDDAVLEASHAFEVVAGVELACAGVAG